MNTLLVLNIDQSVDLQVLTEVEDNSFINLYNTYLSVHLRRGDELKCLSASGVGYDLYYIAERVESCLNLQRYIPAILGHNVDIGLLWHQHWQKIALAEDAGRPLPSWDWPGMELYFLQNKGSGFDSCLTWLYNDEHGQIVMQVSNAYPWFFKDAPSADLNISYDDWLPQYKILYKTIIPRDVAQEWVKGLHGLYARLELNT